MKGFYGKLTNQDEEKNITINEAFTQWQNYNVVKNLSEHSIDFYNNSIDIFRGFYDCDKPCKTISEPLIFEYTAFLRKKNINGTTVNTYLRGVRAMCYYFMKMGYVDRFSITLIKTQKNIKETYTDTELSVLLKKPKILILDDSTSAVDTRTDALIRKAFREEIPDTTKLIIAQRISSVQDADRIIVMEGGRINAVGTHEELLSSNVIYKEVYNSQIQGGGDFDE